MAGQIDTRRRGANIVGGFPGCLGARPRAFIALVAVGIVVAPRGPSLLDRDPPPSLPVAPQPGNEPDPSAINPGESLARRADRGRRRAIELRKEKRPKNAPISQARGVDRDSAIRSRFQGFMGSRERTSAGPSSLLKRGAHPGGRPKTEEPSS
jgi:hypothetical protein